jgi:acyl carrier protein
MNDIHSRLLRCFAAAFPEVSEEELPALTPESTEQWDSEAMAILLALIQEEFGFEIDAPEELEDLDSFPRIYEYVRSRAAS